MVAPRATINIEGTGVGQGAREGRTSVRGGWAMSASSNVAASASLSECPTCAIPFDGRLSPSARQAHIQRCLDSLQGVFSELE